MQETHGASFFLILLRLYDLFRAYLPLHVLFYWTRLRRRRI